MERGQQKTARERGVNSKDRDEVQGLGDKRVEFSKGRNEPESLQELLEKVVEKENLQRALSRVVNNGGASGVDGMTVKELPAFLKADWLRIKEELLAGSYQPRAVKRVEIPKPGGGVRRLGIPTVLDRLIQ